MQTYNYMHAVPSIYMLQYCVSMATSFFHSLCLELCAGHLFITATVSLPGFHYTHHVLYLCMALGQYYK